MRKRRWPRRLYVREQLSIYHVQAAQKEIPYWQQYRQFLLNDRGCKPATAKSIVNMLQQFVNFWQQHYGKMEQFRPAAVKPGHVRRYLSYLKNEHNNAPSTRNGKLSALSGYYFFLECCGYLDEDDNPLRLIRRARVPSRLPVCLALEEAEKLLQAAAAGSQPERDSAILRVMLQAGLRVSELLRLRVEDIDFAERCLLIQGKGEQQRLVPLTRNTEGALKAYLAVRIPSADTVEELFLNWHRKPLTAVMLNRWFQRLCRDAGVQKPGLSVRNLRHTCMTMLLQEGAELMALKKLAGHKRLSTTQRYLHVTQGQLRKAMEKYPLG